MTKVKALLDRLKQLVSVDQAADEVWWVCLLCDSGCVYCVIVVCLLCDSGCVYCVIVCVSTTFWSLLLDGSRLSAHLSSSMLEQQ